MNTIVTGCAGFIGSHLTESLLKQGIKVYGIDNFDDFYDESIKRKNIEHFINNDNFQLIEKDLTTKSWFNDFENIQIDLVIHLAAKAGVRPSVNNPVEYLQSNIIGTFNVNEFIKQKNIKKYIFASSSSVYGDTNIIPFNENECCNHPISPYAYTKKTCEVMNYTLYSLYQTDILNLRFFTVYGPRQRPDLAIHKFFNLIYNNKPIEMYGDGTSARDYTYVLDIIEGVNGAIKYIFSHENIYEIINIGNHYPVKLIDLINEIQKITNIEAKIIKKPMNKGEVNITYADISKANKLLNYKPKTNIQEGLKAFNNWYIENYG
jgi:nucleoside-diphosphate-sugar epimerase